MVRRQEDGIYVDAGHVRRYDPGSGAYIDAESGKAQKEGAWEEVWPQKEEKNYMMLYDAGEECTEHTGGWTYHQTQSNGYVSASRWSTDREIDLRGFSRAYFKTEICYLSGSTGKSHIEFGIGNADYSESRDKNSYKRMIALDIGDNASGKPYVTIHDNTIYETTNKGERRNNCLYAYHRYGTFSESEIYVYACLLAKSDDWQTWVSKAGLHDGAYAGLEAVMSDAAALSAILTSSSAVDFMLRTCTGTVMIEAARSGSFITALGTSPYKEKIYKNRHWSKFLEMSV